MSGQNGRSSAGPPSRRGRRSRSRAPTRRSARSQIASSREPRSPAPSLQRVEAMQAQIVAASLHVGGGERDAERLAQDRQVLEEDLLLQVLGAGGDEDALRGSGWRGRDRRASCRCRCRLRRAARRRRRTRRRRRSAISSCAGARLEAVQRERQRSAGANTAATAVWSVARARGLTPPGTAGTSGTGPRLRP